MNGDQRRVAYLWYSKLYLMAFFGHLPHYSSFARGSYACDFASTVATACPRNIEPCQLELDQISRPIELTCLQRFVHREWSSPLHDTLQRMDLLFLIHNVCFLLDRCVYFPLGAAPMQWCVLFLVGWNACPPPTAITYHHLLSSSYALYICTPYLHSIGRIEPSASVRTFAAVYHLCWANSFEPKRHIPLKQELAATHSLLLHDHHTERRMLRLQDRCIGPTFWYASFYRPRTLYATRKNPNASG